MDRYYFSNPDGTNIFELDYITGVTGLGLPPVVISSTSRGRNYDGIKISKVKYDARPFAIAFDVYDPRAIEQMRSIAAYFADNQPKTFWYQHNEDTPKFLEAVQINAAVDFDLSECPVKALIMPFLAPDPWLKINIPYSSVIYEEAALEFDFEIPEDGIEFSVSSSNAVKTNNGDKIGDTIIRFTGGANQPYIENITTGEKLVVNRNVAVTDILEINSATGRVDIIDENGVRHNAFNYIGDNGDLIHLAVGENVLRFGAELGSAGQMEVSAIEYYASI